MSKPISRRRHRSREEIAAILSALDSSGQSAAAFSRSEGLALSTLRVWMSRRAMRSRRPPSPALVPVTITAGSFAPSPLFEVVLAGGRILRFACGVPTEELAAICDALDRPCSR